MKTRDVESHYRSLLGRLGTEEGLLFGDPEAEVRGIQVCWMASLDAIEHAAQAGHNVILAHEDLYMPIWGGRRQGDPTDMLSWPINQRRVALLARHDIAVIRGHSSLDQYSIHTAFAARLGLDDPVVDDEPQPYRRIYELPPGTTFGALIEQVKAAMGMPAVRATPHDPSTPVHRVGLPWGGLGLGHNARSVMQPLLRHAPDVFIAGESDNFRLHFAWESGVPMIETSHEISENPGLVQYAAELQAAFPALRVEYYENPMPWRWA